MARKRVRAISALAGLSGELDGYIYKKFPRGGRFLARRPRFEGFVPAGGTLVGNERWRQATAYASAVWEDPAQRAFYVELARKRHAWRAYNLATGDFMNAPEIDEVILSGYRGRRGGVIEVRARDDVGVIALRIEIRDTSGKVWEFGLAELTFESQPRGGATSANRHGRYTATQDIPPGTQLEIEVRADDRAGNRRAECHRLQVRA